MYHFFHSLLTSTIQELFFLPDLLYDLESILEIQESEKMQQIGPGKVLVAQQLHISSKSHIQDSSIGVFQHQP